MIYMRNIVVTLNKVFQPYYGTMVKAKVIAVDLYIIWQGKLCGRHSGETVAENII